MLWTVVEIFVFWVEHVVRSLYVFLFIFFWG